MKQLSENLLRRRISLANKIPDKNIIEAAIIKYPDARRSDTAVMFRVRRGAIHAITQLKLSIVDVYHINECIESKRLDRKLEV